MNAHVVVSLWLAGGIVVCLLIITWDAVCSLREHRPWPF